MKRTIILLAAAMVLAGCSETQKAANDAYYGDKPAHITCYSYAAGGPFIDTDTKGRIEYDDGGRITFVDAKTGELVKTEGECVVRYKN